MKVYSAVVSLALLLAVIGWFLLARENARIQKLANYAVEQWKREKDDRDSLVSMVAGGWVPQKMPKFDPAAALRRRIEYVEELRGESIKGREVAIKRAWDTTYFMDKQIQGWHDKLAELRKQLAEIERREAAEARKK